MTTKFEVGDKVLGKSAVGDYIGIVCEPPKNSTLEGIVWAYWTDPNGTTSKVAKHMSAYRVTLLEAVKPDYNDKEWI